MSPLLGVVVSHVVSSVPMAYIAGILAYVALNMVKWDEIKEVHRMNRFHIVLMY